MGRPIKKTYFGNKNLPDYGNINLGSGVGGEGVATIAKNNTGTGYTTSTTITGTMSAPQVPGGVAATVQLTTNAGGNIATVTLLTSGSGYTSAPTWLASPVTAGTSATFTVSLTSGATARPNAIGGSTATAYLSTGSSAVRYDIVKQTGAHKFLVQNAQGIGQCKLVAASPTAGARGVGEMTIIAQDANGSTYYVTKLTSRKALLTRKAMVSSYVYATGDLARWTLDAAVGTDKTLSTTKVQIQNN